MISIEYNLSNVIFYGILMNRKEWKLLCASNKSEAHKWYNKVKKFLKSLAFEQLENCDKDAKVIHHLRDTEEQRKYNDEHYELFGFEIDENGNEHFEYGKYVVFWTKEHHNEYHHCSEETKAKISAAVKLAKESDEIRKQLKDNAKNLWRDENFRMKMLAKRGSKEHRDKLSKAHLGHKHTEATKKKMSESRKGHLTSEETREKISAANKGNKARLGMKNSEASNKKRSESMKGFKHSDETKANMAIIAKKLRAEKSAQYKVYKECGGTMSWNEFQANFNTLLADKFFAGTVKQENALNNADKKFNSYDEKCDYLKSIGLYEDDGYRYGSSWLYREIDADDLKSIYNLLNIKD